MDTLLLLLSFTKSQREKNIEGTFLVSAGAQGKKQQVLGMLYHNIYQIQKNKFPVNLYLWKVYLSYFQPAKS